MLQAGARVLTNHDVNVGEVVNTTTPVNVQRCGWRWIQRLVASTHGAFVLSVGIQGFGAVLALTVNVLLARLLGASEYGRYMTLLSSGLLLGSLATRGDSSVLTREFASRAVSWRPPITRWTEFRVARGAAVAMTAYLVWLAFSHNGRSYFTLASDFIVGALLIGFVAITALQAGALNGVGASLRSQAQASVLKNGGMLFALGILFWIVSGPTDATQAVALQVVGYVTAFVIGRLWLRAQTRCGNEPGGQLHAVPSPVPVVDKELGRSWAASSRSFLLVTMAAVLVNKLDVVIVSALGSDGTTGIYAAGARLAQVALLVALSVNVVLSPKFARAGAVCDVRAQRSLLRKGLAFTVPIAIAEGGIAVGFANKIVGVFGPEYASSAAPFMWVTLGYAVWTLAAPIYALLSMTGSEKIVAGSSWLILIINFATMVALVPRFGATGAAIAMAVGFAVSVPVTAIFAARAFRPLQTGL